MTEQTHESEWGSHPTALQTGSLEPVTQAPALHWQIALTPEPATSLADLRTIKDRWITQAEKLELFESCRRIARELGVRCEKEFRYPWNDTPIYRWQQDAVTIQLFTDVGGKYLVSQRAYEQRERLNVIVGGHRVASYVFTNHPHPDRSAFLFIPGSWTMAIQAHTQEAKDRTTARAMEKQETERQALLSELLVGIEI